MKRLINHVIMYDGMGNRRENAYVLFDDKILEIGEGECSETAEEVIDGSGCVLLPGLIESHCHLTVDANEDFTAQQSDPDSVAAIKGYKNCQRFLKNGVTSARSLGTKNNVDLDIRDMVDSGMIEGPNLVCSGIPLTMTGGHCHSFAYEVDGGDEVLKAARFQIKRGADVIKMFASGGGMTKGVKPGAVQMNEDEMRIACIEADKVGKTTAAHSQSAEGNKNAIRAGVTSIEHGVGLDQEAVDMMVEKGTYLVPTLSAPYNTVKKGVAAGIPEWAVKKNAEAIVPLRDAFVLAYKNGVKIAMGTDAGTPFNVHGDVATEIGLMYEYGMNVNDIIISATSNAAKLLQIFDKTGSIEKGKLADLLLLSQDPKENIGAFRKIEAVFKSGRKVC